MILAGLPSEPANHRSSECFALLDDRDADQTNPRSRLYSGYIGRLCCHDASQLPTVLEQMQQALRQGQYAIGLFSYELGAQLQGVAPREGVQALTQILLFEQCERLTTEQVTQWLTLRAQTACLAAGNADNPPAGIAHVRNSVTQAQFTEAIARIHAYLDAGDTYQINYTYRVCFDAFGSLYALYLRLRERQAVPYGALIALPDGGALLSLSPELFVRHAGGEIVACPMKGTAAATDDAQSAATLKADPKNRAENVMIVDLLRNDLGRIAQIGSVQVPQLFDVHRYNSVLQMTSTVRAQLRDNLTLVDLLAALYPCGSITGAPKRRAMQIIRELELTPRGFYTGAIGWFDAPVAAERIGDFCLSVPIRTLALQAPGKDGVRSGEMGVGAGIVYDSKVDDEYAECRLKAQFLTGLSQTFDLFETLYATRLAGCRHRELHLRRLRTSAAYFGFAYDEIQVCQTLQDACANLAPEGAHRLRLTLARNGVCSVQTAPLEPETGPVRVLLAACATHADDLFLRHKTTVRERYDAAWRAAQARGAFDMLFCNAQGELTEGARSNVFVKLDGCWYTPPLSAGLLPGIMRGLLLADPAWHAVERTLTQDDLRAAQEIVVCNAVRGVLSATVAWD